MWTLTPPISLSVVRVAHIWLQAAAECTEDSSIRARRSLMPRSESSSPRYLHISKEAELRYPAAYALVWILTERCYDAFRMPGHIASSIRDGTGPTVRLCSWPRPLDGGFEVRHCVHSSISGIPGRCSRPRAGR